MTGYTEVDEPAFPTSGLPTIHPLRAGGRGTRTVLVAIAASLEKNGDPVLAARKLLDSAAMFEQEAETHYQSQREHVIQIETPDPNVNRALAWSEVAMDQFWACNPDLGCSLVGGYGPTRNARRPQYAWFFAGDALVGLEALLSEGEFSRARSVLEFITKYQDPANGMIWHELSQSASQLDWAGKYPYMYVHVDITFAYLKAWSSYISATGDTKFLSAHWAAIEGAYKYCAALLDAQDGLPRIAKGIRPEMARLTLARKISAITLTVWKKGVRFDAQYLKPQTA